MKTAKWVGGIAVIALVAGAFLGRFMPGMPSMGLPGLEKTTNPPKFAEVPNPEKRSDDATPKTGTETTKTKPPDEAVDPRVLYVVIDGSSYRVADSAEEPEMRPATLSDVAAMAKTHPGNRDGIRVRVERKDSTYQAETDLRDELVKSGVSADAIHWLNGPPL